MNTTLIKTTNDVYRFVERLQAKCHKNGATALLAQLDDALHLGSSALEILGAIELTILENRDSIERLLDAAEKDEVKQVIAFVERAFGR